MMSYGNIKTGKAVSNAFFPPMLLREPGLISRLVKQLL